MNVADACFHTVHDYPGGAEALGPRLGKLGTSLSAEVRSRTAGQIAADVASGRAVPKFGILDADRVMKLTREFGRPDLRILTALAAEQGCMVVELPELSGSAAPAAAEVAAVATKFGELMGIVAESLADGRVTDNERAEVERQAGLLIATTQRMLAGLARMNAELQAGAVA